MSHAAAVLATPPSNPSAGGRLVTADGRPLPLTGTRLTAHAAGGLCRVLLQQRFHNPHAEPLRVTYLFPLPHDGAVSGFAFTIGGRRVVGEVDRLKAARDRFEQAILEGKTAGLLEQVRGSVFTQELGNVPPGAEVVAEITVDQRLAWLPEGAWEWRFPTAVAPRYQGAPGRVADADRLQVEVAEGGVPVRLTLSLEVADPLAEGGTLSSPTHALRLGHGGAGLTAALAAAGGAPLDRDVAIRWPVAARQVGASLQAALAAPGSRLAGRAFGLLTLVPPRPEAVRAVARDLIVLLDTSGSMSGQPLDMARQVVAALVESLGDEDRLELIEFSDAPRRWKRGPGAATARARQEALAWLAGLRAGGCTEMGQALLEALAPLREDAQRQVILVTDGQISFEDEIMRTLLHRLPPASRLHAVAVGDAVNRSLTGPAARAGRGVEVVIGLDEPSEVAAARLLARTVAPVVTGLTLSGPALRAGVAHAPDLFAGAPALLPVELDPDGGALTVRGRTAGGEFTWTVQVAAAEPATRAGALSALYAREQVEALELERTIASDAKAVDRQVEALGLQFQISTRLTSWVAISGEVTVDPRDPTRHEVMPQALPHGLSVVGLGLRACAPASLVHPPLASLSFAAPSPTTRPLEADEEELGLRGPSRSVLRDSPPRHRSPSAGFRERPPAAAPSGTAAPFTLHARLVLRRGRRLTFEVVVPDGGLAWDAGAVAGLLTALGLVQAVVVSAATTAPGHLAAGTLARLTLTLEPQPGDPAVLRIILASGLALDVEPRPSAP
ncbi:MAG: VWA domain-containing protein [Anaeromyxobacter sp.]|nr:VWA domain-containing protein [Anaeromyxobacter sp.]MBL0278326.1 VWA domain-containing protein [Anaeromyxobacter sp.]